jgi:FAD/FMN-containing dehydrogenase
MADEPQLTGRVVWPREPIYLTERLDYNERFSFWPRVIVFCYNAQDVANALRWAAFHGAPVRARCGRHSYEAFSLVDDGVIIDVSYMDQVTVNGDGTATVQAGIDLWPLYQALAAHGVTIPGGSCPTVGVSGLTLGGGFGLLGRQLGLTCDSLVALEMVTAAGQVVHADEGRNPELLWASRGGGGGSFGVVTSLTFRVHPVADVSVYNLTWPWEDLPDVVRAWQAWAPYADPRLTSILKLQAKSAGTVSSLGQLAAGGAAELWRLLEPLVSAGSPTYVEVQTLPYIDAVKQFAGLTPGEEHWTAHWHGDHSRFKNTSAYAREPFGDEAIAALVRSLEAAPASAGLVQLDAYGPPCAVDRVPREATAFWHREGTLWNMQFQAYWTDDADQDENIRWVEGFRTAMLPFTHGAYANYCDIDIADWPEAYYGGNFARLVEVKAKWDPENVFNFAQSIPTRLPG